MNTAVKGIQVDDPNAVAFVWEPGNATRYEMAVVRTAHERVSVCVGNFGIGRELPIYAFRLPPGDSLRPGETGYLAEKLKYDNVADLLEIAKAVTWAFERMERRDKLGSV